MKIVTADQMREIERRSEVAGVSTRTLMENAGRAVAHAAQAALLAPRAKRVLVLVGPGNNGGDGLVAARYLHDAGAEVAIYLCSRNVTGDANYDATQRQGIPAYRAEDDASLVILQRELQADLIVDALLGTGRARPITGLLKAIVNAITRLRSPKAILLAVDLPTGLNADTGAVDESCLRADLTVTLGFPKIGLFLFPGAAYVGGIEVGDIGLPTGLAEDIHIEMTTPRAVAAILPRRPLDAHKGSFGKVMVAAGSINYVGAPALCCTSAGRVGAGLVTLACGRTIHPILATKLTEATFLPLPECEPGALSSEAVQPLLRRLQGYDVLLLGPGLGRAEDTESFVLQLLASLEELGAARATLSCVADADALNALATIDDWWRLLPPKAVLTPHSGEMARLLRIAVAEVNADRVGKAREAAARWGVVVVLKGAFSIIAAPDGNVHINPGANPALATAGTGDVLAGAIAGLLAQGLEPYAAAIAAVHLHSKAGAMAGDEFGAAGVLAGDLLPLLPRAIRDTLAGDERS